MRNTHQKSLRTLLAGVTLITCLMSAQPMMAQQTPAVPGGPSIALAQTNSSINVTFPLAGNTYTRVPAITGTVTDPSLGIERVFIRIYDQTAGTYFDGESFSSSEPVELTAYGTREWILETPVTYPEDHVFIIALRGETSVGTSIDFPERYNFGINAEEDLVPQQIPASLEPDYALLDRLIQEAKDEREEALRAYIDSVTRSMGNPLDQFNTSAATVANGADTVATTNTDDGNTATAAVTTTVRETITRSAAGENGSGSTMEGVCAYTPEQFIRDNSITSLLRETCKDPRILQNTLQLTTEENYNIKYKEYYDRGLLRELPEGKLNTVGIRDSDSDGLSDKAELAIGTDPFYWDSDQDGVNDGSEVLDKGSNPLDKESLPVTDGLVITNIKDGMRTRDSRPLVVGSGTPNAGVKLYEMKDGRREMLIGEATTDEGGAFLIDPFLDLPEGEHRVAAFHTDEQGNVTGQSQTVYFIIDKSLNIPPPDVTRISSTKMKPQVYGTTVFGATVVGHFKSELATSAVISDIPEGEFVVTSSRALAPGPHRVVLYATLPNNVRSEKVTVPFTMAEDGSIILDSFPYWWILGGAAVLLLIMLLARAFRRPDTVLFSIDRNQLTELEKTNRIGQITWESYQPLTSKDLGVKFIGFYLNTWAEKDKNAVILRDFNKAKPATLLTMLEIQEMYLVPEGGGEPIDVLFGKDRPKDVRGYSIRYVMNVPKELLNKYFPVFDGKKLVMLSEVEHYTGKLSATLRTKDDLTKNNSPE